MRVRRRRKTPWLSARHIDELAASGIPEDLAEEAGLFSTADPDRISILLNRDADSAEDMGECLMIPFRDVDGDWLTRDTEHGPVTYCRAKPQNPREKKGRTIKYESPIGCRQVPYLGPATARPEILQDVKIPLLITEGEKKTLCLEALGYEVIGLTGVWGWKSRDSEDLVEELNEVRWKKRLVWLIFDRDAETNPQVMDAAVRLAARLRVRGAEVAFSTPPPYTGKGIDDFVAGGGRVEDLVEDARELDSPVTGTPIIRWLSDVEPKSTTWLWEKWIPDGEITILDGDPGTGKSQMTADVMSRVTNGWIMPPVSPGSPWMGSNGQGRAGRNVVALSAEDSVEKTIVTRAIAAGADRSKIAVFEGITTADLERHVILPTDFLALERFIDQVDAALVVIDPLMAFIPEVDTHRDASIRAGILAPLQKIAVRLNVAIILVRHLNKAGGASALHRGSGSIAISGQARAVLLTGFNPEDPGKIVLSSVKSNLSNRPRSLAYHIEPVANEFGGTSRIIWDGETDLNADILVRADGADSKGVRTLAAEDAIRDLLAEGPRPSAELMREVIAVVGCSERLIKNIGTSKIKWRKGREPVRRGAWWTGREGCTFPWEESPGEKKEKKEKLE